MANDPVNLYDYEARAKLVLPHNNWEFIEAGSMDEFTTRRKPLRLRRPEAAPQVPSGCP